MGFDSWRRDSYSYRRRGTFWRDDDGDISLGAILAMIFVPFGVIMGLIGYGSSIHNSEVETAITDLGSVTNPCLDLKAEKYVVIDTYFHDSCKKVVAYYLDQLGYKPMPNTDLSGKKVTLVSGDVRR